MSKISIFNKDIDSSLAQQLNPVVYLPKIAAPYTTVTKRAQCTDFSSDLLPRFGIERVMIQSVQEVQGETGPSGQRVYKPINDQHDAVRFVGIWNVFNNSDGPYITTNSNSGSYFEVTFYGTGLNVLIGFVNTANRELTVAVDGGSNSTVSITGTTGSSVINSRNYGLNIPINVASGLALGVHTVKITTNASSNPFLGYEILNTNSTLQQTAGTSYLGGKRLYNSALSTSSPTSGFTNTYGTAGTRGGHVLVYQKADGSIAKDIRYTEAASATLTSASHSNEEVIRTLSVFEFSAGRNTVNPGQANDDYGTFVASGAYSRAFTLDDGTTTLATSATGDTINANGIGMDGAGGTSFTTLTFVGTGLDVFFNQTNTFGASNVSIDGAAGITLDNTQATAKWVKIVSGLPYGTHTCKISVTAGGAADLFIQKYMVYGPSKPALPVGCVELADYYVMADYANDTASPNTVDTISTGVLRKLQLREMVYSGTWSVDVFSTGVAGGFSTYTSAATTDYVEYTFFGTGFNLRSPGGTGGGAISWTASLDGPANTNWSSYTTSISGGGTASSWTASTGVISVPTSASRYSLFVSGLPLGKHTVRLTKTSGAFTSYFNGFDIITPIHAPKGNLPGDIQNTQNVGSCAISDNRKFSSTAVKTLANWAQAVGVVSDPTTTSTTFIPMPDMSVTIKTTGNPIDIRYSISALNQTISTSVLFAVYVDGVAVGSEQHINVAAASQVLTASYSMISACNQGVHKIDVYWRCTAGTAQAAGIRRILTVTEL